MNKTICRVLTKLIFVMSLVMIIMFLIIFMRNSFNSVFAEEFDNAAIEEDTKENDVDDENKWMSNATELDINKSYDIEFKNFYFRNYKFTVDMAGQINLYAYQLVGGLHGVSGSMRWDLYDSSGECIKENAFDFYYPDIDICGMNVEKGTYYLRVSLISFRTEYLQFYLEFHNTEDWEVEYNNVANIATKIISNKTYSGRISRSSDVDWFVFNHESSNRIQLEFLHSQYDDNSVVWEIFLYDETQSNILFHIESYACDEVSKNDYAELAIGKYYIKIIPGSEKYSTSVYRLQLNECSEHLLDSGIETKKATIISFGEKAYTCEICGATVLESDRHLVWVLPVICGVGAIVLAIGIINYVRIIKKGAKA